MPSKRAIAAEAYVRALRTGESTAVEDVAQHLAKDVVLKGATVWGRQGATVDGFDDVLYRVTGQWPNTPVYVKGFWSFPQENDGKVKVSATFPAMGAAPAGTPVR